jgi:hypothetical protein
LYDQRPSSSPRSGFLPTALLTFDAARPGSLPSSQVSPRTNFSPAPLKKPSRRSRALAAEAVPTKTSTFPPCGRSVFAARPAT